MKKTFSIIVFLLGLQLQAQPYAAYTPALKQCYANIIALRFDDARSIIRQQQNVDPHNRCIDYLEAVMFSLELFISDDKQDFEALGDQFEEKIERLEELPEGEALKELFIGEIHLANAILNGKFKNNFTAAYQFFKAYQALSFNRRQFPGLRVNNIPLGVLYAAIGSLPEDYRTLASMLGFDGDVQKGMAMLRSAYQEIQADPHWNFYAPYAGFIYAFTDFQLDNGQNPVTPASLHLEVASSSFLIYLQARIMVEQGEVDSALFWLDHRPVGAAYLPFPYLDYLEGKTALGVDNERAERLLRRYLRQAPGDIYLKSSYRYLSWIYLLKGDTEAMKAARQQVLHRGNSRSGADRQALEEARRPLNKLLVEARILFDAARYQDALELLAQHQPEHCCPATAERCEYFYRQGRVLQELKRPDEAINAFKQALAYNHSEPTYSLGNSALQLAYVYERQGQQDLARQYFKQALHYKDYPFYEGVHQKAKAGLSRLRN